MVEGKVNESFGPVLDEWRADSSPGKQQRFDFLLHTLGISSLPNGDIRYRLFHRAASAITTHWLERLRSVHRPVWRAGSARDGPVHSGHPGVRLFAAWVTGDCSFLKC
jgi:hypothetical protein